MSIDALKMMMAITDLGMCSDDTPESKLEAKARMIFMTTGIIKPDDWDELPYEEKKTRIDKIEVFLNG